MEAVLIIFVVLSVGILLYYQARVELGREKSKSEHLKDELQNVTHKNKIASLREEIANEETDRLDALNKYDASRIWRPGNDTEH